MYFNGEDQQLDFVNVPIDSILTDASVFTFMFYIKLTYVRDGYSHLIYQFNPDKQITDRLILYAQDRQEYDAASNSTINVNYLKHRFNDYNYTKKIQNFQWMLYGFIRQSDGSNYKFIYNTKRASKGTNQLNIPSSVDCDQKLQIGGSIVSSYWNISSPRIYIRDIALLPNIALTDDLIELFRFKKLNRLGPYYIGFHYPLIENSIQYVQYNKGISHQLEYQQFSPSLYPSMVDFTGQDNFIYGQKYNFFIFASTQYPLFQDFEPQIEIEDWTLQFYAKSISYYVTKSLFRHQNWLDITATVSACTYELKFLPHLPASTYTLTSKESWMWGYWTYTTIAYKKSENMIYFYRDGLILCKLAGGEPIPTDKVDLYLDTGNVGIYLADFRIWSEFLSPSFISFNYEKRLNGYYYPNLLLYLDLLYPQAYTENYKVFQQQKFEWRAINPTSSTEGLSATSFCKDDQFFDGLSCQPIKYLWLRTNEIYDLKLPMLQLPTTPQDFTFEFWFLMNRIDPLENVFLLELDTGTTPQYICFTEQTPITLFKLFNCNQNGNFISQSANANNLILTYDEFSDSDYLIDRNGLSFQNSKWHKFSMIYDNSDRGLYAFIDADMIANKIIMTNIAAEQLSKFKQITFCYDNNCNTVITAFSIFLVVKRLNTRQDMMRIPSPQSNIHASWMLTEGSGNNLYDSSMNQLTQSLTTYHSHQNIIWRNIHQISPRDEALIVCGMGSIPNENGQCIPIQASYLGFYPQSSNNFKLKNRASDDIQSREWTFEFWSYLQIDFTQDLFYATIISQDSLSADGSTCTDSGCARIRFDLNSKGEGRFLQSIIKDTINNQNLNFTNKEHVLGLWSHYAVVNYGHSSLLYVFNDGSKINSNSNYKVAPLSNCDIVLGLNSFTNSQLVVLIKELRIWGVAHTAHNLRWRMMYGVSASEPGLLRYYKFDDERVKDLVSQQQNTIALTANLFNSFDDKFDFQCPPGYFFIDISNDCQTGFPFSYINYVGNVQLNYREYLEPLIQEKDYSFTFLLICYTSATYVGDYFNNQDLYKVITVNRTYQTSFKWNNNYGSPIASSDSTPQYWFFNYDIAEGVMSYYVNTNLILQKSLATAEMPDFIDYTLYAGSNSTIAYILIKSFSILYPQMTVLEMKKMVQNGQNSHFKYKSGYISIFDAQINRYTNLDSLYNHPYDLFGDDWTNVQSYKLRSSDVAVGYTYEVCPFNYIYRNFMCLPYSSLLIKNGKLDLNIADMKIGYSATDIVQVALVGQSLLVQCLSSSSDLSYDTLELISMNKNYNIALVLLSQQWKIYINGELNQNVVAQCSEYSYEDISPTSITISNDVDQSTMMRISNYAVFGSPLSQGIIYRHLNQEIDKTQYINDLLVYYRLQETHQDLLYDLSQYSRTTQISSSDTTIGWDYQPNQALGRDMRKTSDNSYILKDKALYFGHQQVVVGGNPVINQLKIGQISSLIGGEYTISFCYMLTLSITTATDLLKIDQLANFKFSGTNYLLYFPNSANVNGLKITHAQTLNKWNCIAASYSQTLPYAYFIDPDQNFDPVIDKATTSFGLISSQSNKHIIVSKFTGYLREVKIWNQFINEGNILRIYRKTVNANLNFGKTLVTYLKMDESAGVQIYDYVTGQNQNLAVLNGILATVNDNRISWQKPEQSLVICEGDGKYSPYGYCQPIERFLKLNEKVQFNVGLQMKNSTTSMWVLLRDVKSSATIELENRYRLKIIPGQFLYLYIANNLLSKPEVIAFNKNQISHRGESNQWVYLVWRINEETQYCSYLVGKYKNDNSGQLEYTGQIKDRSHKLQFAYSQISPGQMLKFSINVETPTNDVLWMRSLQLWESPLSTKVIQDGLLTTSLDPNRWKGQPLILYLRFDDSIGKLITNTATTNSHLVSQYSYDSDYQWTFYKELQADQINDSQDKKLFLFCQEPYSRRLDKHCDYYDSCFQDPLNPFNTCFGPESSQQIQCNNQSQIYELANNACYDLHHKCESGNYAVRNFGCTRCQEEFYLYNSICDVDCPENLYKTSNRTCQGCTLPGCICDDKDINQCISCKDSTYKFIKKTNTCVEKCPEKTYYDEGSQSCENCIEFCKSCFGPTNLNCTDCLPGYFFLPLQNSCKLIVCQEPYQITDQVNAECISCQYPCESCINEPTNCVSCEKSYETNGTSCSYCDNQEAGMSFPYTPFSGGKMGGACQEICGDGILIGKDQCDDGNQKSGDGCNYNCRIETGFTCQNGDKFNPSICHYNIGPSFEITKLSNNRQVTLQADQKVYTNAKKLTNNDIQVIFTKNNEEISVDYTIDSWLDAAQLLKTSSITFSIKFKLSVLTENSVFLKLKFLNPSIFFDQYGNPLSNQFTNPMPLEQRIEVDEGQQKAISNTAEDTIQVIIVSLTSNAFLALLLGESIGPVFDAMNSVQILYYLPLIDYSFPSNLLQVFNYLGALSLNPSDSEDPITQYFVKWGDVRDAPFNSVYDAYDIF